VYSSDLTGTEKGRKDISLCNLVSAGTNYVYIPATQQIFTLDDPISFHMFTLISVLTVAMAITLSHNLEYSIGGTSTQLGPLPSIFLMSGLLISVTFATGKRQILSPYVTLEDRLSVLVLSIYILYYITRLLLLHFVSKEVRSPVNPILGILVLVTARLYGTLDNPYIGVLIFLLCARFFTKLCTFATHSLDSSDSCIRMREWLGEAIDILFDSVLLSMLIFIGFAPQYNNDPVIMALYIVQGLYAAIAFNSIVNHKSRLYV
jgi:hypothetical protein